MKRPNPKSVLLLLLFSALCNGKDQQSSSAPNKAEANQQHAMRIVSCDAHVQSRKRGVGATDLKPADFLALSKGVSWWYNWHFETNNTPPQGVAMSFIPMVWGGNPEGLAGLQRHLAAGQKPMRILAINEPNLRGQSFLPPAAAAAAFAKIKTVADKYNIPVVGPQMSIGASPADSITAFDPIENKEVTYTFMIPYLKAFFHYAEESKLDVAAVGIHPHMNAGGLMGVTELAHRETRRPLWVTEFNNSDESPDIEEIRIYLMQAADFMERTRYVEGYAFFKERAAGHPKISLLADEPGKLTRLGEAYVNLPVHDADVYYRIPGRLQAENYVQLSKMEIWPTSDVDGFAHMTSNEAGAWLDYNLQVDHGGKYTVQLRVTGQPGDIRILDGESLLATINARPAQGQFVTAESSIRLKAGTQTIRVVCDAAVQGINWIAFIKND